MKNTFQAQAFLESLIIAGTEHDKVFNEVRMNQELRDILGNQSNKEFRDHVDGYASSFSGRLTEATRRGPLIRSHIVLQSQVGMLVGDVMEAMGSLEFTSPRDVRDTIDHMARLERLQSAVQAEMDLKSCLGILEAKGYGVATLKARFDELFPALPKDDDDE